MAKLSDKQRKQIIADRVNGQLYKQIAEKYNVSETTVRNVCKNDPKTAERCADKKEQNTLDMLAFMDAQKGKAQELIRHIIEALDDPDKLAKTNARDLATALGIIIDKFTANAPKYEANAPDDGFMKALKKTAAEDWKNGGTE